jgi:hypothetical protein
MDEIIETFLMYYYTPEASNEITRSFRLFDKFEYKDIEIDFINIVSQQSIKSSDELVDSFNVNLHEKLNYMLNEHTIMTVSSATITEKNEILTALYLIQDLENYTSTICVLESLEEDEVILSTILAELCILEPHDILGLIESFNPVILKTLKKLIYSNETITNTPVNQDHINVLNAFFSLYGKDNLGGLMITNGIRVGDNYSNYVEFAETIIGSNNNQTAINLLSVIYMSEEGYLNPVLTYREHAMAILHDLNLFSNIEVIVLTIVSAVEEILKLNKQKETHNG